MGRPTKLDAKLQRQIVKALKTGATIADVCRHVGIHRDTFYEWLKRGEAGEAPYSDFSDAVTRAQEAAKMAAIGTLRTAMSPWTQTEKTVETFTETRFRRNGEPYEYKRMKTVETKRRMQGDWRAAVEYLKRRYKDEWGDRLEVDWRRELEQAGLDPDAQLDELTRQFEEHLRRGASAVDAGSAEAGTGAS